MCMDGVYLVICEGESECNYLGHLNRFLSTLPLPASGGPVALRFIPKPTREDPVKGRAIGCGSGDFTKVSKAYKAEQKKNRHATFAIWVDADLYVRNDKGNRDKYESRPAGIPSFNFSLLNFEDFLALHADEAHFAAWVEEMRKAGHFECPCHWEAYEPHCLKVFPEYQKNRLPVDFMTKDRLTNLFRHLDALPGIDTKGLTVEKTFATVLRDVLTRNYPTLFE